MVIRALIVLLIELLVCYLFGMLMNKCLLKRTTNVIDSALIGFFTYQIMCQVMALTCYFTTGVLHHLSTAWVMVVVLCSIASIIFCRKEIVEGVTKLQQTLVSEKVAFGITIFVVVAFCYYVAINGETNADSQYYIGLVNTTASTDTLYKYNPYNGFAGGAFFLRRALANFEIHSAILCQLSGVHALVLTRIIRVIQNVILTSGAVYLWGQLLFKADVERKNKKACTLVGIYLILQMVFSCNYYTNAMFFLQRAYEGKAFTANVVLLYVIYISWQFVETKKLKDLLVILLVFWGSVALSSSALFLVPVAAVLVIIPHFALEMWENKGRIRCRK